MQHHGNHNFSCWKKGAEICRFKLPACAWNQISGLIQLELVRSTAAGTPDSFVVKRIVDPVDPAIASDIYATDRRCLILGPAN